MSHLLNLCHYDILVLLMHRGGTSGSFGTSGTGNRLGASQVCRGSSGSDAHGGERAPSDTGSDARSAWIAENEVIDLRVVDGELRIVTLRETIRRVQERARRYIPPGVSLADELSAERREAAKHE